MGTGVPRALAGWLLVAAALAACTDDTPREAAVPVPDALPSQWTAHDGVTGRGDGGGRSALRGAIVGVADPALELELERAMQAARRSAPAARERWLAATEADRPRWAVKWAAPVRRGLETSAPVEASFEYVWVIPVSWSAERIEGVLASTPHRPIGAEPGELVAFAASELADWIRAPAAPGERREGGYTVEVLERAFGAPP